jgi:hypothetical protein
MGLFDDYFDPQQFQGEGGLLGRLVSLQQQQGQYQPSQGLDAGIQPAAAASPPQFPSAESSTPLAAASQISGPTSYIPVGNYLMPQFGGAGVSQPAPAPDLGDRLSAGFQSWAHTPLGNPFAALANGITGFSSGQAVSQPTIQQSSSSRAAMPQQQAAGDDTPSPPQNSAASVLRILARRIGSNPGGSFRYGR